MKKEEQASDLTIAARIRTLSHFLLYTHALSLSVHMYGDVNCFVLLMDMSNMALRRNCRFFFHFFFKSY